MKPWHPAITLWAGRVLAWSDFTAIALLCASLVQALAAGALGEPSLAASLLNCQPLSPTNKGAQMDYDVIVVGGGLAGAALAKVLADHSAQVLVLERETQFRDRVRGESIHPWGLADARQLGLYDLLLTTCARELRWWRFDSVGPSYRAPLGDLVATTPNQAGELVFHHPEMQEVLLRAAASAGAEVWRGVTVTGVTAGGSPEIVAVRDGAVQERLRARLIVGADGRTSRVRACADFAVNRDPEALMVGGVLLRNLQLADDAVVGRLHPVLGILTLIFPLGAGRFRPYFVHRASDPVRRLNGRQQLPDFIAACIETGCDPAWFAGAEAVGPLAMFSGADSWVEHPYREGIVLIGDAAASSDPSWGHGMSLTLRDVRVLRDQILATGDYSMAGHAYAEEHDRYYTALHRILTWMTDLQYTAGPEADARRERVWQRWAEEPGRFPDPNGRGPDGINEAEELRSLG
jgi:flavin-dependent dehydrogenase